MCGMLRQLFTQSDVIMALGYINRTAIFAKSPSRLGRDNQMPIGQCDCIN